MTIPDKAVEAALDVWFGQWRRCSKKSDAAKSIERMRGALAAAEQAMWGPIESSASDNEMAEGLARRFTPVDMGGNVAARKKAILAALVQVRAEGHAAGMEASARIAERTYAKDAFHFELGTAIAAAIREAKP